MSNLEKIKPMRYRKIWSTGPKQYKTINANKAIAGYTDYLKAVARSQFDNNLITAKTFNEWLKTEI